MMPKATMRLIHHRIDRGCTFYLMLEKPLTKIIGAWSAREGDEQPCEIPPPQLVPADSFQIDGDWAEAPGSEVVAESVQPALSTGSAGPVACSSLYVEATDHGTFDLFAGSFTVLRSGLC